MCIMPMSLSNFSPCKVQETISLFLVPSSFLLVVPGVVSIYLLAAMLPSIGDVFHSFPFWNARPCERLSLF